MALDLFNMDMIYPKPFIPLNYQRSAIDEIREKRILLYATKYYLTPNGNWFYFRLHGTDIIYKNLTDEFDKSIEKIIQEHLATNENTNDVKIRLEDNFKAFAKIENRMNHVANCINDAYSIRCKKYPLACNLFQYMDNAVGDNAIISEILEKVIRNTDLNIQTANDVLKSYIFDVIRNNIDLCYLKN